MKQEARERCVNYPCSDCNVRETCHFERMVAVAKGVSNQQPDIPVYMKNLINIREERGFGHIDVAEVLGISETRYARYECGLDDMPVKYLIVLCQYYKVSSDTVLNIKF